MTSNKKYPTPRGDAATKAKNKYRDENYDRIELAVPKNVKTKIKEIAKKTGNSINSYALAAISEKYKQDTGDDL